MGGDDMTTVWTVEDYARHYVETINAPPNGWGQHVSPLFGQSHSVMIEASKRFGSEATQAAIQAALKEG